MKLFSVNKKSGSGTQKINYETWKFPGGEVGIRIKPAIFNYDPEFVRIEVLIKSSDDIMLLLNAVDALKRIFKAPIQLFMPYVPYARQDRVMSEGESLSIKVFANLINSCGFSEVIIEDPHSDVVSALINNVTIIAQEILIDLLLVELNKTANFPNVVLVSPDAGANKKILKCANELEIENILYADKVRDVKTGKILSTVITQRPVGLHAKTEFIIIDDICDGGRTFIELAKVLRQSYKPKSISLYVTHGIFSAGFDELLKEIDKIYVVNSFVDEKDLPKEVVVLN